MSPIEMPDVINLNNFDSFFLLPDAPPFSSHKKVSYFRRGQVEKNFEFISKSVNKVLYSKYRKRSTWFFGQLLKNIPLSDAALLCAVLYCTALYSWYMEETLYEYNNNKTLSIPLDKRDKNKKNGG